MDHKLYEGNATTHDLVVEKGNVFITPEDELVLTLTKANNGTKLSSMFIMLLAAASALTLVSSNTVCPLWRHYRQDEDRKECRCCKCFYNYVVSLPTFSNGCLDSRTFFAQQRQRRD